MLKNRTFYHVLFFWAVGFSCDFFLWRSENNSFFIAMLSPVLALSDLIPNSMVSWAKLSPEQSQFIFTLPFTPVLTLVYFGLLGYWIRQILRESGFLKYFLLIAFAGFLVVIHWQSLEYIEQILTAQPQQ